MHQDLARLMPSLRYKARQWHIRRSMRHLRGPRNFPRAETAPVLVCPIKDGAYWLPDFLNHHRELGVAGFVFVDTGSTDGTLDLLDAPDVAVMQSAYGIDHENTLRHTAATKYGANWVLFVDSDEMFEAGLPLPDLCRILERDGYSGLSANMLDMFPQGTLGGSYADALIRYSYCEIRSVDFFDYHDRTIRDHRLLAQNEGGPRVAYGGVRKRIFGEDPFLSKHPLVRSGPGIWVGRHPHVSTGLRVAPYQGLIRHYKFTNDPMERDRKTVEAGTWIHGEDASRNAVWHRDLSFFSDDSIPFSGVAQMREIGFLSPDVPPPL